ncbi:MAG: putative baseplate assembly protein, partial [Prochloraceae cyanobacterium]
TIIRGKNTVFTQELKVGDKIIVEAQEEAQERTITSISSDVICTINTSFAFNSNINLFDPNIEIKIEREGKSEQDTVSGTIFDGVVIGKGTNFTSELRAGDAIIAAGQIKIVEAVFSATEIAVNKFFETDLPEETPYFVNSQGEGSIFHIVYTATFSENPGLQTEDVIIAAGQLKTIRSVDSPTEVTLYTAFDEDLSAETPFFIPTPGQGSITSSRDRTVTFSEDPGLQPEDIIIAAGQLKIITSVNTANQEVTLDIDKAFDEDLSEETPFFVPERGQGSISRTEYTAIISDEPTFLFAATAHGGVFRSLNKGGHWEAINTGLTDLETRSLVVHPHNGYLFGGTANGRLYRSTNLGNIWNPIDAGLSSQSVGAIAIASNDKELTEAEFLFGIDILFTGAGNKVFRSTDYGRNWQNIHWQRINQGLSSLTVQAIAIHREQEKLYLFAGTREGAFSSTDGGQQWQPINDGLTNLNVQALLGFSSSFQLYAGTKEGLFRSLNYGEHWLSVDIGIAQAEIKALAFDPTTKMVFAATFADGVIRYSPESDRWIPLGLTDAYLQAMVINPANGYIFVGTTSSGIFYSTNQGNSWQQLIKTRSGTGTMTSDGINVTGAGTKFAQELRVGSKITVAGQDRTVVSIAPDNPDTSITIDQPFRPDLRSSNSFTIHTGLNNLNVTALAVYPLPGTGTITSDGIKVTGKNTKFNTELTIGDTITVAGQTQTVTGIISDTELTVEEDFTNLPQGTPCTINQERETVIRNNGTLSSKGTRVIFQGTTFRESAIIPGDEIEAVGQDPNPIIKEIISDQELIIDRAFTKLPEGTPFTRDILFAGTAGSGILRSTNQGKRWSEVNAGLNNHLEIRCLSLDKYGKRILAGTALGGVFGSTNLGGLWEPLNTGLTNTDIRAIAIDSTNLFVGGIGILLSQDGFYSVEVQPSDWLSVLTVPKALSMGQQWQVKNPDDFQGTITTLTTDDITLYPAADEAETISELGIINIPPQDQQQPILELDQPLSHSYDPATVTIYGNIVEATHGETVSEEVLGSGDGAIANQRFELQKPPLTYISATTVSGIESTLTVYVNDVAWERANSLYALDQLAQGYIVRQENDGTTQVIFGDGERGARLPSGQENVVANYRSGIGVEGNIGAESLTILKTRPLGLEEVTNPLPATGGAEREDLAEARNNAPLTIRTLDRIVSLQDFEDFARSFAGIIKAQAVPLWTENNQLVHITVAAAEGDPVPVDSALYRNLVDAIDAARDPVQRVEVDSYQAIVFNLEAKVAIDPRYPIDQVENTIHLTLQQIFSFDRRGFGQAVTASEIIATIQKIEGVIAVDLDSLYARGSSKILNQSLIAQQASWDAQTNQISPAQLLFLDSDSITLSTGSSI